MPPVEECRSDIQIGLFECGYWSELDEVCTLDSLAPTNDIQEDSGR